MRLQCQNLYYIEPFLLTNQVYTTHLTHTTTTSTNTTTMAAIVGNVFGTAIEGCTTLLSFPFRVVSHGLSDVFSEPFSPYLFVTFAMNAYPAISGLKSIRAATSSSSTCTSGGWWLLIEGLSAAVHIFFSFYIVGRVKQEGQTKTDSKDKINKAVGTAPMKPTDQNSWTRIKEVLWRDPGVAAYIFFLMFWVVWMFRGMGRFVSIDTSAAICEKVGARAGWALFLGWSFMGVSTTAFVLSSLFMKV